LRAALPILMGGANEPIGRSGLFASFAGGGRAPDRRGRVGRRRGGGSGPRAGGRADVVVVVVVVATGGEPAAVAADGRGTVCGVARAVSLPIRRPHERSRTVRGPSLALRLTEWWIDAGNGKPANVPGRSILHKISLSLTHTAPFSFKKTTTVSMARSKQAVRDACLGTVRVVQFQDL